MKDLLLTDNGKNLSFSNLDLQFTPDTPTYVSQKLRLKLLGVQNAYFTDTTIGLPWFTQILEKNPNMPLIADLIKAKIMEVSEVSAITSFGLQIDKENRKMQVNFSIALTTGETVNLTV